MTALHEIIEILQGQGLASLKRLPIEKQAAYYGRYLSIDASGFKLPLTHLPVLSKLGVPGWVVRFSWS